MSECPHCKATEHHSTCGRTLRGSQRYKCRQCAGVYTPDPLPLGYPEETRREAVRLYLEGVNFRRIGRILSVNHQSVINWVNSDHAALPATDQTVGVPEVVELDELIHLRQLQKTLAYVVAAIDRATRRILAYDVVWERTPEVLQGVIDRAPHAPRYFSDALLVYRELSYWGQHTSMYNKSETYPLEARQRRPAPLSGTSRQALTLLFALHSHSVVLQKLSDQTRY